MKPTDSDPHASNLRKTSLDLLIFSYLHSIFSGSIWDLSIFAITVVRRKNFASTALKLLTDFSEKILIVVKLSISEFALILSRTY
jgi:hypothetical protein